jgi:hypothetical protein
MNIFKFLDDTIRGTILFVFNFIGSTVTLLARPLTGSRRLLHSFRDADARQISSVAYLTIAIGIASRIWPLANAFEEERGGLVGSFVTKVAKFATTGSTAGGFFPFIAGALCGSMLLCAALRLVALGRGFAGARYHAFVTRMEYQFGAFIMIGSLAVFVADTALIDKAVLPMLGLLLIMLVALASAVQFYSTLVRTPRLLGLARALVRSAKLLRTNGWSAFEDAQAEAYRRWLGIRFKSGARPFVHTVVAVLLLSGLWILSLFCVGVAAGTVFAASTASNWIQRQEEGDTRPIVLIAFACDLGKQPSATVLAWNRSSEPVVNWTRELVAEVHGLDGGTFDDILFPLHWRPQFISPREADVLAPGESAVLRGPVVVPAGVRSKLSDAQLLECRIAEKGEIVRPASDLSPKLDARPTDFPADGAASPD